MPGNDEAQSSRAAPQAPAVCAGPATGTTRASSLPDFRAFSFSPMHQAAAALHNERTSHPMSEPLQVWRCCSADCISMRTLHPAAVHAGGAWHPLCFVCS